MMDGEQHFQSMRTSSGQGFTRQLTLAAQSQQAINIDQDFNERARQAGFSVLRLQYLNRPVFSQIVFPVVKACRDRSFRNKIAFRNTLNAKSGGTTVTNTLLLGLWV